MGSIAVLKHGKPKRLGTIDEESAAEAAWILNNLVPPAILADQKSEDLKLGKDSARRMAIVLDDHRTGLFPKALRRSCRNKSHNLRTAGLAALSGNWFCA